jgi:AraC-like DNA-binding protein
MQQRVVEHRYEHPCYSISCEARPQGFVGPQHACHLDALELCIIESGIETVTFDRLTTTAGKGYYGTIRPGVDHSSWVGARAVLETNLHLRTEWLRSLCDESGAPPISEWSSGIFVAPQELLETTRALRQAVTRPDGCGRDLMISSLTTYLGAFLLRVHHDAPGRPDRSSVSSRLRGTAEWMRECLGERFTVEMLARSAGMSQYHYLRAFKKQYGISPYAFLLRIRADRAAELARSTDIPFTQLAMDLGFGSSSRLTEAVKRAHGATPSELRRPTNCA